MVVLIIFHVILLTVINTATDVIETTYIVH